MARGPAYDEVLIVNPHDPMSRHGATAMRLQDMGDPGMGYLAEEVPVAGYAAPDPFGEGAYGVYAEEPYGEEPYGQEQYGEEPYGEDPYGEDPYGEDPYGEDPYGEYAEDPYGEDPYGEDPYGEDPYGEDPYGEYAEDPYGEDPYGEDPYAGYAEDPYGMYAEDPYAGYAEDPYAGAMGAYPVGSYAEPAGYFAQDLPVAGYGYGYSEMPEMVGWSEAPDPYAGYGWPGLAGYGALGHYGRYVREVPVQPFNAGCPVPTNVAGLGGYNGYVRPRSMNPACGQVTETPSPPGRVPDTLRPLW